MTNAATQKIFYGWWIVVAAFLNLFLAVGVIFYGFPVFYPAFVQALGFSRGQVTQGFLLGFLIVGLPFGLLTGILIDRIGARAVILSGVGLIGLPLIAMGHMHHFWQYQVLCVIEVIGYVLAGPISNQVLIAHWFHERRGRAMGYAYLGLGLGGAAAPPTINWLIRSVGWRHALEIVGAVILIVLFPVGVFLTRSTPADMGLNPDGALAPAALEPAAAGGVFSVIGTAMRDRNFWLILAGSALVIGAMNAVIQHFIFFLVSNGYSSVSASRFLSVLLLASLGGRVIVGYIADRFRKKNTMALFYALLGLAIPILFVAHLPVAAFSFAVIFGFAMGADYMLIPLVTAECFGVKSLGKLLALIIAGYSIGQWMGPWVAGRIFDRYGSYDPAWKFMCGAALLGAAAIYAIRKPRATIMASPEALVIETSSAK
ncbi:sugar phosphate permease [Terriglobus roseus DSM 18391]|uniref:Sugar phosphate permease n=1 Tax=Terriglobus roseus (strain DSM 18391 / NRRL B-41598 / KBS 63) TaxID=926566 RepID=I3ZE61_TERRK|nr:MFS transporter [Terriglobus roseus]AFL87529.1 sugar phosphate permease [Terriglobus roseus DSM 18391]